MYSSREVPACLLLAKGVRYFCEMLVSLPRKEHMAGRSPENSQGFHQVSRQQAQGEIHSDEFESLPIETYPPVAHVPGFIAHLIEMTHDEELANHPKAAMKSKRPVQDYREYD